MSTTLADIIESAVRDGEELVSWAAPNAAAMQWEPLEEVVLRALGGPIAPELAFGIPLLRFANGSPAIPLVQAVMNPPVPRAHNGWHLCDVTGQRMREPNTLWVPCGASVVQVTMRNHAREVLADLTRANLVWS